MSDESMDLRTFVAEAITQIVQGVVDAQRAVESTGARVNPHGLGRFGTPADALFVGPGNVPVKSVTFDVAVTLDKTDSKKGRIGVAAVIGAGVEGGIDTRNQVVNRLTFSVPLMLPIHGRNASQAANEPPPPTFGVS
jgi:hypothetical protein